MSSSSAISSLMPSSGQKMILTHYSTGQTDIPPLYEGRVTLAHDIARGKADLKLRSITLQDNKVFSCRLQIPKDDEGKLVDSVRLVVLGNLRIYPPPRMTSNQWRTVGFKSGAFSNAQPPNTQTYFNSVFSPNEAHQNQDG